MFLLVVLFTTALESYLGQLRNQTNLILLWALPSASCVMLLMSTHLWCPAPSSTKRVYPNTYVQNDNWEEWELYHMFTCSHVVPCNT